MAPLATGALSGLASTGVSKILGNGITIPLTKQQEIISRIGPYLTNAQINQHNLNIQENLQKVL